jgi:hypothetical protein
MTGTLLARLRSKVHAFAAERRFPHMHLAQVLLTAVHSARIDAVRTALAAIRKAHADAVKDASDWRSLELDALEAIGSGVRRVGGGGVELDFGELYAATMGEVA